jgi:hypothetical protein
MRRSRTGLERAISEAQTNEERAIAHYNLGLFHDNNGREAEAFAWLASSLYKTDPPAEAFKCVEQALGLTDDAKLIRFLNNLQKRIRRKTMASSR